ncbi:putative acyltransferase domain-containing protein [Erysiphe necator]|uniref:Putative acyltransferase domain-containing protein n=1 Tax=Uncinula necator TaxID=52586 RepID=A0A0B1PA07_UNCNE|nr:putative acyltransferase domain-containing protein [Erysiphe necator]
MDKIQFNSNFQTSIRTFFQPSQSKKSTTSAVTTLGSSSGTKPGVLGVISHNTTSINLELMSQKCSPSNISSNASIIEVEEDHLQPLRRINALLLPISFPDSFYRKILSPDPPISFSRSIIWSDPEPKVVGGILCRIDPTSCPIFSTERPQDLQGANDIYILSLTLLSPFRGQGLATQALRAVIDVARKHKDLNITSLYAHVWTENKDALKWYFDQGFQRGESVIHGYYRTLKPDTAWILRRRLTPTDYLTTSFSTLKEVDVELTVPPARFPKTSSHTESNAHPPARSFQGKGPDQEWNDLPDDVVHSSQPRLDRNQGDSTRSKNKVKSHSKSKKKRVYPVSAYET